MKKIFSFSLLLFFLTTNLNGHISHYKGLKKIEMEIFRNNKLIGYNYYFFTKENDITLVTNQIKFTVELLGATIFKIEGYGEEKYKEDKLISFKSKTLQNNKKKFVDLKFNAIKNKFEIKGSSFTGEVETINIIGNWWNHKLLQANSQISPISGSVKEQVVIFVGREMIELYGKKYETEHFKLKSKNMNLPEDKRLNFDIWYNKENSMILKVSYSRMGNWEYKLKNFE
jgi:hypothetical protein